MGGHQGLEKICLSSDKFKPGGRGALWRIGAENIYKYNEDKDKHNIYGKQGTYNNVCWNETKDLIAHIYILIMAEL